VALVHKAHTTHRTFSIKGTHYTQDVPKQGHTLHTGRPQKQRGSVMTYGVYSIDAWIETEGERVEAGITHAQVPGMSVDVVFRQPSPRPFNKIFCPPTRDQAVYSTPTMGEFEVRERRFRPRTPAKLHLSLDTQHLAVITRGGIDDQRSQPRIDQAPIDNTFWTGREFTF